MRRSTSRVVAVLPAEHLDPQPPHLEKGTNPSTHTHQSTY